LFLFTGDDFADLVPSDPGSITSEDDITSESDDDDGASQDVSVTSSTTSLPPVSAVGVSTAIEQEFQTEVRLSLDRAFSEGHSLEEASLELKTLRMASNVPLRRVREAVVAGIVERIPLVEGAVPQRAEIKRWVDRWGELINLIGGVDGVETVSILQVKRSFPPPREGLIDWHVSCQYHCASSTLIHLFGQILAALYQKDIVEEEDIRRWHAQTKAQGEGIKNSTLLENVQRTWIVGARMIDQFDEQDSEDAPSSESEDSSGDWMGFWAVLFWSMVTCRLHSYKGIQWCPAKWINPQVTRPQMRATIQLREIRMKSVRRLCIQPQYLRMI
jgi:translation initiation factor eIF-2B subunit epsilon